MNLDNEKLIDKKSLKQSIFNIYNSSSNKKLVEEEFNYCLDCINALINELELAKGSKNIYIKALQHCCYKLLLKDNIAFTQENTKIKVNELVNEFLEQARKELENV